MTDRLQQKAREIVVQGSNGACIDDPSSPTSAYYRQYAMAFRGLTAGIAMARAELASEVNRSWLSSESPRPEIIAVSATVWGVRHEGAMICAPTIDEAVTVIRNVLSAKGETQHG